MDEQARTAGIMGQGDADAAGAAPRHGSDDVCAGARTSPRVLVVDDDESIREMVDLALTDVGYDVVGAPDGASALLLLEATQPDVILLDVRMPVMGGWEFTQTYRRTAGPHAPIIVMSAAREAGDSAMESAADGVLLKPFMLDALYDCVAQFAHRS